MPLAELGLATRQEVPPEEIPDNRSPGGQNEMVSKPGSAMAVSQVVKTARVWPCLENTDGRFLPTSMGRGETANVSMDVAEAIVDFALEKGTIEKVEGPSQWCSAIPLVSKQKGKVWSVVDVAKLHMLAERPTHPFPTLRNTNTRTPVDPKYFAVFDVASGHWQISFDEVDGAVLGVSKFAAK